MEMGEIPLQIMNLTVEPFHLLTCRSSPVKMLSEEHEQQLAQQQPQKKNPPDFADFSQTKLDVHQVC